MVTFNLPSRSPRLRRTVLCTLALFLALFTPARADAPALADPTRPVAELTADSFVLQWFTATPTPTVVRVRAGDVAAAAVRGLVTSASADPVADLWKDARVIAPGSPPARFHRVVVRDLAPGTRYFYQVASPADERPTREERDFGALAAGAPGAPAEHGWRREFGVSTLAGPGRKTIIRYPVKVLLMPNVVNLESAFTAKDGTALTALPPAPPTCSSAEKDAIRAEFAKAARFFWINSGMRFWVDFHIVFDDRWQRWGPVPSRAGDLQSAWVSPDGQIWSDLKALPQCRSYEGVDYSPPGGGGFTMFDPDQPADKLNANPRSAITEDRPYFSQIEVAFPRRWDPAQNRWVVYTSGGGTLGVDAIPHGLPGRSQFFGGYDTAWLATHEFHHQMESLGTYSLSNREDERIVYNHWSPRSRDRAPDAASGPEGLKQPHPWTTSARHGEHYDGMAYWDRTLSAAQWLRLYFGRTITVADRDNDGIPDDDARLPLDEKRFGSDPDRAQTDGAMNDLAKAQLSTFAPEPLQVMFTKPTRQHFAAPNPRATDSDGDGLADGVDPAPLVPHAPFVWPLRAEIDGDAKEWGVGAEPPARARDQRTRERDESVPVTGVLDTGALRAEYRHGYDQDAYYGCLVLRGPWQRVRMVLDGEGQGVYSGEGVQAFQVFAAEGDKPVRAAPTFVGVKGWTWKAGKTADGADVVEFKIENWPSDGPPNGWFWQGAGREVGLAIEVQERAGGVYSVYEPYMQFWTRMIEGAGLAPMPGTPPAELMADAAGVVTLRPGDAGLDAGGGWELQERAGAKVLAHVGGGESAVVIREVSGAALNAGNFDLWVKLEAKSDAILGGFVKGQRQVSALRDYLAFIGGYSNTRSRLRLFGNEAGEGDAMCEPGVHTMQLSRRDGVVWVLWDGRPVIWAKDPDAQKVVDRLAVLGGYDGAQVVHEVRVRTESR